MSLSKGFTPPFWGATVEVKVFGDRHQSFPGAIISLWIRVSPSDQQFSIVASEGFVGQSNPSGIKERVILPLRWE